MFYSYVIVPESGHISSLEKQMRMALFFPEPRWR
jgi:hypothetical protein